MINFCQEHIDFYDICLVCEINRLQKEIDGLREGEVILRLENYVLQKQLSNKARVVIIKDYKDETLCKK